MTETLAALALAIERESRRCVVCGKFVSDKEIAEQTDNAWPVYPDTRHSGCAEATQ